MRDEDGLGLQLAGARGGQTGERSVRYLGDKIVRMQFVEHLLNALCAQVLEQWIRKAHHCPHGMNVRFLLESLHGWQCHCWAETLWMSNIQSYGGRGYKCSFGVS